MWKRPRVDLFLRKVYKRLVCSLEERWGKIVFKTIVENVHSFFGREDELLSNPKEVPDPASDVFEHPNHLPFSKKIVEKSLPDNQPSLPFSPDQLKAALEKKKEVEKKEPIVEEHDISHEIDAFENAIITHQEKPLAQKPSIEPISEEDRKSFFDEFSQFALHENIDAGGLLEGNILDKMKEFHRHMSESNEYLVYSSEVRQGIDQKLSELRTLESEWFHTKRQLDECEKGLVGLEEAIKERSTELKQLVSEAKSRKRLEETADPGQEFVLYDGRKLSSLLDLKIALRTMPDSVFRFHVDGAKHDFANWAQGTFKDKSLASNLRQITDKEQMLSYLQGLAG